MRYEVFGCGNGEWSRAGARVHGTGGGVRREADEKDKANVSGVGLFRDFEKC